MRKFQRFLFVSKRSYICYYLICMTVTFRNLSFKSKLKSKTLENKVVKINNSFKELADYNTALSN